MKTVMYDPKKNPKGQTYVVGEVVLLQRQESLAKFDVALVVDIRDFDKKSVVNFLYCERDRVAEKLYWDV